MISPPSLTQVWEQALRRDLAAPRNYDEDEKQEEPNVAGEEWLGDVGQQDTIHGSLCRPRHATIPRAAGNVWAGGYDNGDDNDCVLCDSGSSNSSRWLSGGEGGVEARPREAGSRLLERGGDDDDAGSMSLTAAGTGSTLVVCAVDEPRSSSCAAGGASPPSPSLSLTQEEGQDVNQGSSDNDSDGCVFDGVSSAASEALQAALAASGLIARALPDRGCEECRVGPEGSAVNQAPNCETDVGDNPGAWEP
jgi:hypothetical protein